MGWPAGTEFARAILLSESLVSPGKRSNGLLRKPQHSCTYGSAEVKTCYGHNLLHSRASAPGWQVGAEPKNSSSFVQDSYLVDPASSHMLVSKIKPCMSKYKKIIL